MKIKTASDLKYAVESAGNEPYFFTRAAMTFFGDTMRNYGVRQPVPLEIGYGESRRTVMAYELFRRRPVKHGLRASAWFDAETFAQVFPDNGYPQPHKSTMKTQIQKLFDKIALSAMFRLNGPPMDDLPAALIALAEAVHGHDPDTEGEIWSIGESGEFTLDSLLIGAYWACTEWSGGQDSATYAAQCAIGRVYKPGPYCKGPECEADDYPYQAIGEWFAAHPNL